MSFPPIERITRAKMMLDKDLYGYRLRYYEYSPGKLPPLVSFMVIDSEEVIIAFYRTPYMPSEKQTRLAIKHKAIVRFFQDYYDTIWQGGKVLKEGNNIQYELLNEIHTRLSS